MSKLVVPEKPNAAIGSHCGRPMPALPCGSRYEIINLELVKLRRFLVNLIRRSFLLLLVVCLGCVAQNAPSELSQKIERQVRSYYKIPAEVKLLIGAPSPSTEFPTYETVTVTVDNGGKKQDLTFLVSKDHSSMMRLTKFDLSKDPFAETMSKIDTAGRPTRGAKASKVVVVNFDDFECPFCARMHQTLFPEILKEYGDRVTFIYKDYPLVEIHPWAMHAAVDANCLAAQNNDAYWDFADYIHANQHEVSNEKTPVARLEALDKLTMLQGQKHNVDVAKLQSCIKAQDESAVKASMKQAENVGVEATPTLFVSGAKIDGAQTVGEMRAALDHALKDANLPVPDHTAAAATPASK
jgi:protein-disulfide isomerase